MSGSGAYRRLDEDSVIGYARRHAACFGDDDALEASELSDGNINYVFRVRRPSDGASVVVKQADVLLRSSGRPLDQHRIRIEAEVLAIQHALAGDSVPAVLDFDGAMSAIVMEDIGDFQNLRQALMAGRVPSELAAQLSRFLRLVLLPTTDLVLPRGEKRRNVARFTNPELCDITEDLVLTEPYWNYKQRNHVSAENVAFVETNLYENPHLHAEVARLRNNYLNNAQALLHGDLHTGSIFVNETGIKVIDCEFACYGPMGYDIGNVLGNLVIAWTHHRVRDTKHAPALERLIKEFCDRLLADFPGSYDELVTLPLYREPEFRRRYLRSILADSLGYAGTELVRRGIGDARCAEVETLAPGAETARMERAMVLQGIALVLNRERIAGAAELLRALDTAFEGASR